MDELKKELLDALKAKGLDVGEDVAMELVKLVFPFLGRLVLLTENKVDDMLIAVLPIIEKQVIELLDKIDGKEGQLSLNQKIGESANVFVGCGESED